MLIQFVWLVPLIVVTFRAPESPLNLVRKGQNDQAEQVLRRLSRDPLYNATQSLGKLVAVNAKEEPQTEQMGFMTCLRGANRRRTEIAVVVYSTQQLVGLPLIFWALKLLEESSVKTNAALLIVMANFMGCIILAVCSIFAMRILRRRTMWLCGLLVELLCLLAIGVVGFFDPEGTGVATSALVIVFGGVYNFTIGPLSLAIVSETPATRLKGPTNCMARATTLVIAIGFIFLAPTLLEDNPGLDLKGSAALFWAATAFLCLVWAYFRLPNTSHIPELT